jgi:hypothetical protein
MRYFCQSRYTEKRKILLLCRVFTAHQKSACLTPDPTLFARSGGVA